jgi:hypothetical protein
MRRVPLLVLCIRQSISRGQLELVIKVPNKGTFGFKEFLLDGYLLSNTRKKGKKKTKKRKKKDRALHAVSKVYSL